MSSVCVDETYQADPVGCKGQNRPRGDISIFDEPLIVRQTFLQFRVSVSMEIATVENVHDKLKRDLSEQSWTTNVAAASQEARNTHPRVFGYLILCALYLSLLPPLAPHLSVRDQRSDISLKFCSEECVLPKDTSRGGESGEISWWSVRGSFVTTR